VSSHFGSWSLDALPNFQRVILGVKTHFIEKFFTPLKYLGMPMFKMGLYDPFEYLKHKLWSKEGLGVKLSI